MAKKENTTKSFVLRVDAATMEAIENGLRMNFAVPMGNFSGLSTKHYAKAED